MDGVHPPAGEVLRCALGYTHSVCNTVCPGVSLDGRRPSAHQGMQYGVPLGMFIDASGLLCMLRCFRIVRCLGCRQKLPVCNPDVDGEASETEVPAVIFTDQFQILKNDGPCLFIWYI